MKPRAASYRAPSRAERVIAGGRVVLGLFSLLAIWLDPSTPAVYESPVYPLLGVYAIYSLIVLALVWLPIRMPGPLPLGTHAIDLAMFTLFIFFTEGPTSPFFVYFVFSIMCATLRWGWPGTFWTAVIAISIFLALGLYATRVLQDPAFELHHFIIRAVYLTVVAGLVGYMGAHERRAHRELTALAGWPRDVVGERQALLRDALARVGEVLRAPRVVLIWEQPEEPSTNVVVWHRDAFEWTREPPGVFEPIDDATASATESPAFVKRFGVRSAPSWAVSGQGAQGRLYCLDLPRLTLDDMALGEISARLMTATLDSLFLLTRLREAVASEERVRLARNLHDSVVQSLTGVALQLQTARQLLDRDPRGALARLREMQETLAGEQHRLRGFISRLRPFRTSDQFERAGLAGRLTELCRRIERQWGMRVHLATSDGRHPALAPWREDIYYLINEALINAARHAQATSATVELKVEPGAVRIEVADDGCGFPFAGRYGLEALVEMSAGPHSIKDRILDLSGQLEVDSSAKGTRLIMLLPAATPTTGPRVSSAGAANS
jgi:signal transduction histidine kinase